MTWRSSFKTGLTFIVVLVGSGLVAGGLMSCGLKGPLYVPEDKSSQEVSSQSGTTQDTKKQRSTNGSTQGTGMPPTVPTDTTGPPPSSTPPPHGH